MSNKGHHRPLYRIVAIILAYVLLGAAFFVPLGIQKEPNVVLLIVLAAIWLLALTGTIVANEIIIRKKYGGDFLEKEKSDENR
ncbi:MAG: hypothetical protein K6E59_03645 [Bacilli bacterium]|nr:hypothetical protein [Bacilli bacterium]